MKYFGKLIVTSVFCLFMAILVVETNGTRQVSLGMERSAVIRTEIESHAIPPKGYQEEKPVLIIYSPGDAYSVKYRNNLEDMLRYLKWDSESVELERTASVSYYNYRMVILASQSVEQEMKDIKRLFRYVEDGGRLFWGILQNETESEFQKIYKKMGIMDYGDYVTYQKYIFEKEILPGMQGEEFDSEEFTDVSLFVRLEDDVDVYAVSEVNGQKIPLIWSCDYGKGRVVCYNSTSIAGDFYKGLAAGCLLALEDTVMYPIINAKCVFVDDFPSPQYESDSDVVRKDYNRSVKEFYRDIWWPDMQKVANKLDYVYTGLFVATYNDIVEPEDFAFEAPSMEQYYGNSLLRAGHEMGAHGYNHQSLAGDGQVPEEMGYNAWASETDMEAALQEFLDITGKMFPGVRMQTYVPPSNYLDSDGRQAVAAALPDLKAISGVYTNEGEEGAVYQQRFEIAEDGVAEFPRITSGMLPSQYERFEWLAALGLHGVFSHFVHPDDIFDEERGKGENWETLRNSYEQLLKDVNAAAPGLRSLKASEAADALKTYVEIEPFLVYEDTQIRGSVDHFPGEAWFFLKTDRKPIAANDACRIMPMDEKEGRGFYLVQVKQAEFSILLEEK